MKYPEVNGAVFSTFSSPQESIYYSHCLRSLVFERLSPGSRVVEFGSGDGTPVISAIQGTNFQGAVRGFELNPNSAEKARSLITRFGVDDFYQVVEGSFFDNIQFAKTDFLISDPPFLPSMSPEIMDPLLWGGVDGSEIYIRLIEMGYERGMLMIASYSNPMRVLQTLKKEGYHVQDFLIAPMSIGVYSREAPVWKSLMEMKTNGTAFMTNSTFLLAGVLVEKNPARKDYCLFDELAMILTSLH